MNMSTLFPRLVEPRIAEALLDTPVVMLSGPRQAGKTTLVRQIAEIQGLRYPPWLTRLQVEWKRCRFCRCRKAK